MGCAIWNYGEIVVQLKCDHAEMCQIVVGEKL